MHLSESNINPYSYTGIPIRNIHSRILKLWFKNTCWTTPYMKVAKDLWHCLKHLPWPYFNSGYSRLNISDPIVNPYIITHCHWPKIIEQYSLRTFKRSVYQNYSFHIYYHLDGALSCLILIWVISLTKPYILLLLKQLLYKLWSIEDQIIILISLDHNSITLRLPI